MKIGLITTLYNNKNKLQTRTFNKFIREIQNATRIVKLNNLRNKYLHPLKLSTSLKLSSPALIKENMRQQLEATLKMQNHITKSSLMFSPMANAIHDTTVMFGGKVGKIKLRVMHLAKKMRGDTEYVITAGYYKAFKLFEAKVGAALTNYKFSCTIGFKVKSEDDEDEERIVYQRSKLYDKKDFGRFLVEFVKSIEQTAQSNVYMDFADAELDYGFITIPAGGRYIEDDSLEPILKRKSVARIFNTDDNCFWHAIRMSLDVCNNKLTKLMSRHDYKKPNNLKRAESLCNETGLVFNKPIALDEIAIVEDKLQINIFVLNMRDLPITNIPINLFEYLMYKNHKNYNGSKIWLLYDDVNEHYHMITTIRNFMGSKYFCEDCFQCFKCENTYDKHKKCLCSMTSKYEDEDIKTKNNTKTIYKESNNYMYGECLKGSLEEINKLAATTQRTIEQATDKVKHPLYIVFDIETDTSTLRTTHNASNRKNPNQYLHRPMHIEVDIIRPSENHEYEDSLIEKLTFPGYNCIDDFCRWLFNDKTNMNATVMAHNGAGYDSKFIKKWCVDHGMPPNGLIEQGSRVTYMKFNKNRIRMIDTLHFFQSGLRKLPAIFGIKETVKGFFPHHFNTPENQNYIGIIPNEAAFGYRNTKPEEHEEFLSWYEENKTK